MAEEPNEERGIPEEEEGLTCKWCGYEAKSPKALDSHVGKMHPKELLAEKGLPVKYGKMSEEDIRAMIAQEGRDGLNKLKRERLEEILLSHPKVAHKARVYVLRKWETNERMRDDWREMLMVLKSAGVTDDTVAYDIINDVWSIEEKYAYILQQKGQRVFSFPPRTVDQPTSGLFYQPSASYYQQQPYGQPQAYIGTSIQTQPYPQQPWWPTQPMHPLYGSGGPPFGYPDITDKISRILDDKFKPIVERTQQIEQRLDKLESKGEEEVIEVETMIPLKDPQTGDIIMGEDGKPITYPRKMRGPMGLFMTSGFLVERPSLSRQEIGEEVRRIIKEEKPSGPTEREKVLEDKLRELTNTVKEYNAKIESYKEELSKKEREAEKKELLSKIEKLEEKNKEALEELKATINEMKTEKKIEGYQSDETRFLGQAMTEATGVMKEVLKEKRLLDAVRLFAEKPVKEVPIGAGRALSEQLPPEYVTER